MIIGLLAGIILLAVYFLTLTLVSGWNFTVYQFQQNWYFVIGLAMVACCSHYLVNILPWLGVTGALSIIGQYQQLLFWLGLVSNLLGIGYLWRRICRFKPAHAPL